MTIFAGSLLAADSSTKQDVTSAAKKLAQQDNYSWKSTMDFGNFASSTEGKAEKDGLVALAITSGENTREAILKGDKGALRIAKKCGNRWRS